jgi:hypothetical protein
MSDAKLTKLTGNLLCAMREQVEELVCAGHVDGEALKLVITAQMRRPAVKADHEAGLSNRQIAKKYGVSEWTVREDLNVSESARDLGPTRGESARDLAPQQTDLEEFTGPVVLTKARSFEEAKDRIDAMSKATAARLLAANGPPGPPGGRRTGFEARSVPICPIPLPTMACARLKPSRLQPNLGKVSARAGSACYAPRLGL